MLSTSSAGTTGFFASAVALRCPCTKKPCRKASWYPFWFSSMLCMLAIASVSGTLLVCFPFVLCTNGVRKIIKELCPRRMSFQSVSARPRKCLVTWSYFAFRSATSVVCFNRAATCTADDQYRVAEEPVESSTAHGRPSVLHRGKTSNGGPHDSTQRRCIGLWQRKSWTMMRFISDGSAQD